MFKVIECLKILNTIKMNDIELFLGFLKDESIYGQYMHNYINEHRTNSLDYLKTFHPESFIYGTFYWGSTNEGVLFWGRMHSKWLKYLVDATNNKKNERIIL